MSMEKHQINVYVPPTLEVTQLILEEIITASPIKVVNLKEWEVEGPEEPTNNADVWLNF